MGPIRFATKTSSYYLILSLLVVTAVAILALYTSRVGRSWRAIKLNPHLAETIGIDLYRYRLLAFIISSVVAGTAGNFYAHYFGSLEPDMFSVFKSIYIQIYSILGGLNYYLLGPVLGSWIMTFLPEFLRISKEIEPILTGGVLIGLVIFLPGGILSLPERFRSFPMPSSTEPSRRHLPDHPMEIFINSGEHTVPLLELKRLTKHFGGLSAITELNLDVSGLRNLRDFRAQWRREEHPLQPDMWLLSANQRHVKFEGKDITGLSAHRIAQLGIGRSFQASTLFLKLTVFDNVFIGFNMAYKEGVWKSFLHTPSALREERIVKEKVSEIPEFMGMADLKIQIAYNLPHGHQRILGVCIALATRPRLLLLDEPLTGMHPEETARMLDLIRKLQERDITIVLVEHNMDAVMQLCDRIVVLNYGESLPKDFRMK